MSENQDNSKIKDIAGTVKGIVENVPVYQDVLQPAAKEIGIGLQQAVHIALAPLRALVWSYDRISLFVTSRLNDVLCDVPPERIASPDISIAGPVLESLRFVENEEALRDMFVKLLATSMDIATAGGAHPSFVEIIKNLSPDEAKILIHFSKQPEIIWPIIDLMGCHKGTKEIQIIRRNFNLIGYEAECAHPRRSPSYIENLARLGLAEISETSWISQQAAYEPLENSDDLKPYISAIDNTPNNEHSFNHKLARLTNFGDDFCYSCIRKHSTHRIRAFALKTD